MILIRRKNEEVPGYSAFERAVRNEVMQKMVGLVALTHALTLAYGLLMLQNGKLRAYQEEHGALYASFAVLWAVTAGAASLSEHVRRTYPTNMSWLMLVAVLQVLALGSAAAHHDSPETLLVVSNVMAVCAVVVLFSCQLRCDLFPLWGWPLVTVTVLSMCGMHVAAGVVSLPTWYSLATVAAVSALASLFLVADAFIIVMGDITWDDGVYGALTLLSDPMALISGPVVLAFAAAIRLCRARTREPEDGN